MCGRFNLKERGQDAAKLLQTMLFDDFEPGFNIAPTDSILMMKTEVDEKGNPIGSGLHTMSWGLIPQWVKDLKTWKIRINARMETVATNGCFRSAFRSRRCLVPMTGFYEWQKNDSGGKQPYEIVVGDQELFCVAGIWEHWKGKDSSTGEEIEKSTVCVLTCPPNKLMADIHDRMPVILPRDCWTAWMDDSTDYDYLGSLMSPYPASQMQATPISTAINNARNKSANCIQKLAF